MSTPTEAEQSLSFREIVQDTIEYDAMRGTISVGATAAPDARKLAGLFAEHMLGAPDFFADSGAGNFYTLELVSRLGAKFQFKYGWDTQVSAVRLREVFVDERDSARGGGRRYSPWAMTVRDKYDALACLARLAPEIDVCDLRINYVKLEFVLTIDGAESTILVKVKPPCLASFRDHSHESIIFEHLERNGIRLVPSSRQLAAAAE